VVNDKPQGEGRGEGEAVSYGDWFRHADLRPCGSFQIAAPGDGRTPGTTSGPAARQIRFFRVTPTGGFGRMRKQ
jgi:hypothetical protein